MAVRWQFVWLLRFLFVFQFLTLTTLLGLFGHAQPDTFSTKLRQDGALNGFNSSPLSGMPFVWSQALIQYNIVLSVASFLLLVVQITLHIVGLYFPVLAAVANILLIGVWTASVVGQAGADNLDPEHRSPSPWFLRKACRVAFYESNIHYCHEARAAFGVSILVIVVYLSFVVLAVYSLIKRERPRPGKVVTYGDSVEMEGEDMHGSLW